MGEVGDTWFTDDIERVIVTEDQIREKIDELARKIAADYGHVPTVLLVCILKGAVMFMADFARALGQEGQAVELEFMAISSYGQHATSSGVVRILKDLDRDIAGRHVIVVEDIVDSGLTLSWLLKYVGFDIPNEFVVGYGLDFAERYRELPYVGILKPEVYARV